MKGIYKLYKKENYTIQKSITIEHTLYLKIKELAEYKYYATVSEIVNICIEDYEEENEVIYYPKADEEEYRSIMLRKENIERLKRINNRTGITVTRLVNLAIKRFLECYDNYK